MTAKALVEVSDVLTVRVEFRPPKKDEIGWLVTRDTDPKRAVLEVLDGRDCIDAGAFGFGWVADQDYPEFDPVDPDDPFSGGRYVTVIVEYERRTDGEVILL